jgi:tetratricopeptide (TPR) repeat protein
VNARPRRVLLAAVVATVACGPAGANHETLGDRAYVGGSYAEALTEYRLALVQGQGNAARLRAKAGAAALRSGDLAGAAQEYGQLARADGRRLDEAADGLDRVAREAIARGDRATLRTVVGLLRDLDRDRSIGDLATALATGGGEGGVETAALPAAAANAPNARQQDSLMLAYAQALARAGRCEPATGVFEALARRERAGMSREAALGGATCALRVGRAHLEAGRYTPAEEWFRRAVTFGAGTDGARAGYLGLGDVLRARGDLQGAVAAWDQVLLGAPSGDSLASAARERLNAIGSAGTQVP